MWILVRLIAASMGFLLRATSILRFWGLPEKHGGVAFHERVTRNKRGETLRHRMGVPTAIGASFALTVESGWDKWFKAVGLSEEFQTGDEEFDRRIYIASDHPAVCGALRDSAEIRKAVRALLGVGTTGRATGETAKRRLVCDRRMLFVSSRGPLKHGPTLELLDALRRGIEGRLGRLPSRLRDSFAWRALAIESVVWAIAGFAAVAVVEAVADRTLVHLDRPRLYAYGALAAFGAAVALLAAIVALLRRTSRSHRILVESGVVLLLSLPVFGVQAVADFNRAADDGPPRVRDVRIAQRRETTSRGRRGRVTHRYHVDIESGPEVTDTGLPRSFEVSYEVYTTLRNGASLPLEIGPGRLGIPWLRRINGVPVGG